jgi:hypothetical protein
MSKNLQTGFCHEQGEDPMFYHFYSNWLNVLIREGGTHLSIENLVIALPWHRKFNVCRITRSDLQFCY